MVILRSNGYDTSGAADPCHKDSMLFNSAVNLTIDTPLDLEISGSLF